MLELFHELSKCCFNICLGGKKKSFMQHISYTGYQTQSQCNMSCLMQPTKHSLSSACTSTYIATKQLQLHVLSMSRLSMSHMGTTMLGWEQLPNTPLAGQRKEAKVQDHQSSAPTRGAEDEATRWVPSARPLPGRPTQPRQEPFRGNLPNTSKAATLESKSSDTINHIGTKAREAPPWWHADLCEDKRPTRPR